MVCESGGQQLGPGPAIWFVGVVVISLMPWSCYVVCECGGHQLGPDPAIWTKCGGHQLGPDPAV